MCPVTKGLQNKRFLCGCTSIVNGRVFSRSNKYTFKEGIHGSINLIFAICYMELVMDSI